MRLVLPYAFYRAGNTGDEATLNGFACLLRAHSFNTGDVRVCSHTPARMPRAEPSLSYTGNRSRDLARWWAMRRADACAIVGATPIHDAAGADPLAELTSVVRSCARRGKPLAFVGVGVERLQHPRHRELIANEFAPHVRHWSARSARGCERLLEYGVPRDRVTQTADLAWLIDPVDRTFGMECVRSWGLSPDRPLIGVGITWELFSETPGLTDALAGALDALATDTDAQFLFFAHDVSEAAESDLRVANAVIARMRHARAAIPVPNTYFTPRQFMSLIGCCGVAIATRYHFCVYAAVQHVPFLAVQQSDKVLDLCSDMGWTSAVLSPGDAPATMATRLTELFRDARASRALLAESTRVMRERALQNIESLRALARNEVGSSDTRTST